MDVLLHNLSVCEYKTHSEIKNYMLTLGLFLLKHLFTVCLPLQSFCSTFWIVGSSLSLGGGGGGVCVPFRAVSLEGLGFKTSSFVNLLVGLQHVQVVAHLRQAFGMCIGFPSRASHIIDVVG
jgi:hypothetical protein